jgi:AraC family transcriptional regulator
VTNFEYVQQTIDIFEDSLASPPVISRVNSLSGRIGYSSHHLNRLFQALCGLPLGQYMQKRRLTEAFLLVRDSAAPIADIAFRLGWEDYSAFSRAFRKEYSFPPGTLRDIRSLREFPEESEKRLTWRARPVSPELGGGDGLSWEVAAETSLHVTGLVFYMTWSEKSFHKPWNIFMRNRDSIRSAADYDRTFQFSSWPKGENPDGLWIHCAVKTERDSVQDPVFFSREYPASRILRFDHRGPVENIYQTYQYIWNSFLPASDFKLKGHYEYQEYPGDSDHIRICIPVED